MVTDVPLVSVTVFQGGTEASAHTFNYWIANDEYAPIQQAIDSFIAQNFPE